MTQIRFPIYAARTYRMIYGPYKDMNLNTIYDTYPRYLKSEVLAGRLRLISPEFLNKVNSINMGTEIDLIEIEDVLEIDLAGKQGYLIHNKSGHDDLLYTLFEADSTIYNETEKQDYSRGDLSTVCLDFREKASWEPHFLRAVNFSTSQTADETFKAILKLALKELGVLDIDTIDPTTVLTGQGDRYAIEDLDIKTKATMALIYAMYFDDLVLCYEAAKLLTLPVMRGFLYGGVDALNMLAKIIFVETQSVGFLTYDTPADMYIRLLGMDKNDMPILTYDTYSPKAGL